MAATNEGDERTLSAGFHSDGYPFGPTREDEMTAQSEDSSTVRNVRTTDFIEAIARGRVATGASSKAMAWAVLGWADGVGHAMPYDSGDWGRCVRTYAAAPPHLQDAMNPIMDLYYRRLVEHTERHGGAGWRLQDVVWPLPNEPVTSEDSAVSTP